MANIPRERQKNVTGQGAGVHKRGDGLGTGPVGNGSAMGGSSDRSSGPTKPPYNGPGQNATRGTSGMSTVTGSGGLGKIKGLIPVIIIAVIVFIIARNCGKGGGGSDTGYTDPVNSSISNGSVLSSLFGSDSNYYNTLSGTSSASWVTGSANTGSLNRNVSAEARDKYTSIIGNGNDEITIMVYLCGADLETKGGYATNDLNEMLAADLSDQINLIVYTGGSTSWKNSVVSNSHNQIYKVENGKLVSLVSNDGTGAMTDPDTLSSFIQYASSNYPADRYMMILWDHGGGSVSGYGYDENNKSTGAMPLSSLNKAFTSGGVKFDFIGFDACLMAGVETALMASSHADYLIASEETEPGIGWYYTNWLNELSANTSMETIDLGKIIIDDFVSTCSAQLSNSKATLSITDLAELSQTVNADIKAFSESTANLINGGNYGQVSNARTSVREFAQSSRIDQIDLVNFAYNIGTNEGKALADTLLSAVKYNRTSSNISNAYGLSIYFPYDRTTYIPKACSNYAEIGLDSEYSECIRTFASFEATGQAAGASTSYSSSGSSILDMIGSLTSFDSLSSSPISSLLNGSTSSSSSSSSLGLSSITSLISAFSSNSLTSGLFADKSISDEEMAGYILDNSFDGSALKWSTDSSGNKYISLSDDQWKLVNSVELNMFYDDGEGYIDLGLDNIYTIDEYGRLFADVDGSWLSINNQPVAYYHVDTIDDGTDYTITGKVPALLNGERVELVLIFDNENPYGYVAGAVPVYSSDTTDALAKGYYEIQSGDTLDFLCDYYSYEGEYVDSYYLGEQMVVGDSLTISNTYLNGDHIALYKFTDIYNQNYWTETLD